VSAPRQVILDEKLDAIVAFGRATDEREEAAISLVRITDYSSHAVVFLSRLLGAPPASCGTGAAHALLTCRIPAGLAGRPTTSRTAIEVQACTEPNTLFRANSLGSKALDYYMKHVGMDYLTSTRKHTTTRGRRLSVADRTNERSVDDGGLPRCRHAQAGH